MGELAVIWKLGRQTSRLVKHEHGVIRFAWLLDVRPMVYHSQTERARAGQTGDIRLSTRIESRRRRRSFQSRWFMIASGRGSVLFTVRDSFGSRELLLRRF